MCTISKLDKYSYVEMNMLKSFIVVVHNQEKKNRRLLS